MRSSYFRLVSVFTCVSLLTLVPVSAQMAASKKQGKPPAAPLQGVKTPGVQIPFSRLKSEDDLDIGGKPGRSLLAESIWVPVRSKNSLAKIDAKAGKPGDPIAGLNKPCAGGDAVRVGHGSV
jgi:hypothetical protein